jgi:superfamily II DNA or RNA helicase
VWSAPWTGLSWMGFVARFSSMNELLIDPKELLESLDVARRARARQLHDSGAVTDCRSGRLDEMLVISGLVADGGDQPFSVYFTVEDGELSGDCSCPLGGDCEHVGAVLLAIAAGERRSAPVASASGTAATTPQQMVYLLRLSEDGTDLNVCPARASWTGSNRVVTPYALSRLEEARQPDYIRDEDLAILHDLADRMSSLEDLVWYPLGPTARGLVRAMVETGRCHWQDINGAVLSIAEPLPARVEWELLPSGYQRPVMVAEDDREAINLPLLPPWRVNPDSGRCRMLTSNADESLLTDLLARGPVAPDQVDPVITRLKNKAPRLARPRALTLVQADVSRPAPRLELRNAEVGSGQGFETVPAARLSFQYGEIEIEWDEETSSRLVDEHTVVMVERDGRFEDTCVARLETHQLCPLHSGGGRDYRPGEGGLWVTRNTRQSRAAWIGFQQALKELKSQGWQVDYSRDFCLELVEPDDWYGDLVACESGVDQFDLDLGVTFQGERHSLLKPLLDWLEQTPEPMLRMLLEGNFPQTEIVMALDRRRVVLMPTSRLVAALRALADLFDEIPKLKGERLRLPRGRLAELSEAGVAWRMGGDPELVELTERLAGFERIEPLDPPNGMQAELRGYQKFGLGWLQFLREFGFGGILADDMGLGKTIQTLAHVLTEKSAGRLDRPCLVVAPTSLMFNWRAEARRFAPDINVLLLHGPQRKGLFQWIDKSDLVLTTYPLLPRDIDALSKHRFHLLILDEAQAIKNPRTRVGRIVRDLKARHRLCLTGTPLENHLGELWSLFDFLMPGMLGSQPRFRRQFQGPIEREDDEERKSILARRIRPFFLRRTKAEVAPELPEKTEIVRAVAFESAQLHLYERVRVALHDKVRRALQQQGVERSRIVVLDALLKLRQICCDPRLLKNVEGAGDAGSAKLELLMDLLPDLIEEGRRVLVFSQFVGMLDLIQAEVKRHRIDFVRLDGKTRDRQKVVEHFQTGRVPLFLISLKAGGVGLNLTAADTVIHYDPWWNPAVEDQATDRAHRIGQDQKVFVYKLLTENTIEEKVFEMQQSKRGLVEAMLGGGGAAALSPEDLDALFEPLA